MQPQTVEQAGMGPGEEGSSMDTSLASTTNEPDEDQEGHESKMLIMVGGLDVSAVGLIVCQRNDEEV